MNTQREEISFLGHLEILRWHLIRSVIAVVLFAIICFSFQNFLLHKILLYPASPNFITFHILSDFSEFIGMGGFTAEHLSCIQEEKTSGVWQVFFTNIKIAFYGGFILAFPYIIWEIFRFVKPALHAEENRLANQLLFFASILFFIGLLFGYYVISPLSISFGISYAINSGVTPDLIPFTDIITNVTTIAFANGFLFELPIIVYLFSKLGLITPDIMRKYRRHAIVIILVFAAIMTPPDIISQILVALPVLLLYNISIRISKRVLRNQEKS